LKRNVNLVYAGLTVRYLRGGRITPGNQEESTTANEQVVVEELHALEIDAVAGGTRGRNDEANTGVRGSR